MLRIVFASRLSVTHTLHKVVFGVHVHVWQGVRVDAAGGLRCGRDDQGGVFRRNLQGALAVRCAPQADLALHAFDYR